MQSGGAAPPAAELRWLSMQRVAHVVHGTVTLVFSSTHLGALASLWQGTYEFACVQMLVRRLAGEQASGSVWLLNIGVDVQLSIPAARWVMVGTRGAAARPVAELRWLLTTRGATGLVWKPKWSSMMMGSPLRWVRNHVARASR